jgi:hypothetical protein
MIATLQRLAWAASALWACSAHAQLYVPQKGGGSVSASVQVVTDHWHLSSDGDRVGKTHITTNSLVLRFDYGVTDRLAATLTVPYVQKRFRADVGGAGPHDPDPFNDGHDDHDHDHDHVERLDDGAFHGHWQDWGVGVRYRLRDAPLAITPFFNYSWPSHEYEFFAHAAPGTGQKRAQFGVVVGRPFGPPWINTYASGSYSYTFVEKVLDVRVDYSSLNLELGHHFSEKLSARVYVNYRKTHGGLEFPADFGVIPNTSEQFLNHDRISRIDYLNGGLGLGWQFDERYAATFDYLDTLWGEQGHEIHNAVALTLYRSF